MCLSQKFKYLSSEKKIREYDNKEFIIDHYYFDKEMYEKKIINWICTYEEFDKKTRGYYINGDICFDKVKFIYDDDLISDLLIYIRNKARNK